MEYDVVVCGHTHFPGRIGDWHYNTRHLGRADNSFVRIDDNGAVGVFDWANGRRHPQPDGTADLMNPWDACQP